MPNDLTTISTPSRPVSLFNASNDYLGEVLYGRCDQARLVNDLRDLLSLYYQPSEAPEQRARGIALFVKDLGSFSDDATGWAIEEWRRTQDRRPTPATLRQLCMVRMEQASTAVRSRSGGNSTPPVYGDAEISPETKAERQAIIDRCAKAAGMVRHEGRWTSPVLVSEAQKERERKPHWSETAAPDDPRWAQLRKAREQNAIINSAPEPF